MIDILKMKIVLFMLIALISKINSSEIKIHKSFDDTIEINLNGSDIIKHIPVMIEQGLAIYSH
jgi:hypothetical protein